MQRRPWDQMIFLEVTESKEFPERGLDIFQPVDLPTA